MQHDEGMAGARGRRGEGKRACASLGLCLALLGLGAPLAVQAQDEAGAREIPRFAITQFAVVGNTLLPEETVARLLQPYQGSERDFGDVQRAITALEGAYRQAGYSTVAVLLPEQILTAGVVHLRVVEGRVGTVEIAGNRFHDGANIRASLPGLREGEVPRVGNLSAALKVANENPAKQTALQFAAGETEESLVARLQVADEKPWKAGLSLDNTGTPQTGSRRLGVLFQHANVGNADHIFTYQYLTSPDKPRDVNVHVLAYRLPLYALGDSLDFYASYSDVNAGNVAVGPFNLAITGKGQVWGGRYTWNLPRQGDYTQSLALSLERRTYRNGIGLGGLELGNDLTLLPLSLAYQGHYSEGGKDLSFQASVSRNLGGGAHGDQAAFEQARRGAPRDYQVWRGNVAWSQVLPGDWQWRLAAAAQWSPDPLPSGEQFGLGGSASVRGFYEREVASDRGHQTSVELYTPDLCASTAHRCRALAFYDQGAVYRQKALPGEVAREHLASAGVGFRWGLGNTWAVQADLARVLDGGASQASGDWRLHARIGWFF